MELIRFFLLYFEVLNQSKATPGCLSPPSSPSCCHTHNNYRGDVFFPQTNTSPRTPSRFNRSQCWTTARENLLRRRLNSTGDETPAEIESINEHPMVNGINVPTQPIPGSVDYDLEEHYTLLAAREHLEQFSGQVPPKKKKKKVVEQTEADSPVSTKAKEQSFVWPTVVTAVVLAVGCGFLVTR